MHRFRFTCLKIFILLIYNMQVYIQELVIPSMTHLDTSVNGALIVHWPLAGKNARGEAANRGGAAPLFFLVSGYSTILIGNE